MKERKLYSVSIKYYILNIQDRKMTQYRNRNKIFFKILFILTLMFSKELFFVTMNIIGKTYEGSESSNAYIIVNAISFFLLITYILRYFLKKKKLTKPLLGLLSFNLFIIFVFLFEYINNSTDLGMIDNFTQFILWSLPMMFLGLIFSEQSDNINIKSTINALFILGIYMSLPSFQIMYDVLILGERAQLGGATYQTAGYTLTLALSFIIIKMMNLSKKHVILNVYIVFLLIAIIATGARGPFLVATAILIFYLYRMINLKNIIYFGGIVTLSIFIINRLSTVENFTKNIIRVFEFIGDKEINWSGTSGRDIVYLNSIKLFKERPIFGNGIFSYYSKLEGNSYVHNLFLETLVQGGIIYFLIFIIFLGVIFRKYLKFYKHKKLFSIITTLSIYQFGNLMFSGTYITTGLFWFIIFYIYFNKPNHHIRNDLEK